MWIISIQRAYSQSTFNLQVSHGKSSESITLHWFGKPKSKTYDIYRSEFIKGPYFKIDSVNDTEYEDVNCRAGLEYYYKISENAGQFSSVQSGFRKINLNRRYNLDKLLEKKRNDLPFESELDLQRVSYLKKEYVGWLRIRFIMFIAQPYIINNKITVLTDFSSVSYNKSQNTMIIYPDDMSYQLEFYSHKPFSLLKETDDENLIERLILNGIAFCVYKGETKNIDKSGRSWYIPKYEAVGVATWYHKNYKDWANTTILFSSNREELMNEVAEIEKNGN